MEGIDLAFYKRRSRYHTMFDSIPGAKGEAKASLWAMLENAWATGGVLLNLDSPTNIKPVVYFDRKQIFSCARSSLPMTCLVFKKWFFVFEQQSLHIFNLTFLLAGPVLVLLLHAGLPHFYGHFDASIEEKPSLISRVFAPIIRLVRSDSSESEDSSSVGGFWTTIWSALCTAATHVRTTCVWANIWISFVLFVPSIFFVFLITIVTLKANRYVS